MKLAVFPNEDLDMSIKKGENRQNYFNPNDLFTEIIIFNPSERKQLEHAPIKFMCGKAKYSVEFTGATSSAVAVLKRKRKAKEMLVLIQEHKPDIIRSYGVLLNSYYAAYAGKQTGIPFVLSLHDNYDEVRVFARQKHEFSKYAFYKYWKIEEKRMLRQADAVIAVYEYAKQYAVALGTPANKIHVIYNRVSKQYAPRKVKKLKDFTIINVMRQVWEKNQEVLVRAVSLTAGVHLVLIGSGPDHKMLQQLASRLGCADRVKFLERVANKQLPEQYQRCHLFASSIKQGGVGIPDLEAFHCGIPVVHAKNPQDLSADPLYGYMLLVENTPESFARAFKALQTQSKYRLLVRKSFKASKYLRNRDMDKEEQQLYQSLKH